MATALDVIKRSMRLIGALGTGEEPTADEATDALDALNGMLDAWWSKTLAVYHTQSEAFTWASGNASRTIGTGGNFDTTRPSQIVGAFQRINSVDHQIEIKTREEYDWIPDKTTGSDLLTRIYVDYGVPLITLYGWPVPSGSAAVHIQSMSRLQSFASSSTDVTLPPGYKRALEYNLAIEIAPEYSVQVPPLVATNAVSSLRNLKSTNLKILPVFIEAGLMTTRRSGYSHHTGD